MGNIGDFVAHLLNNRQVHVQIGKAGCSYQKIGAVPINSREIVEGSIPSGPTADISQIE